MEQYEDLEPYADTLRGMEQYEDNMEPYSDYPRYLKTEHWKKVRAKYLQKACYICGQSKELQLHHNHYRTLYREKKEDLTTLCRSCHKELSNDNKVLYGLFGYEKVELLKRNKLSRSKQKKSPTNSKDIEYQKINNDRIKAEEKLIL